MSVINKPSEIFELLQKGRKLPDGTERNWKGRVYVKVSGKWKPKAKGKSESSSNFSDLNEGNVEAFRVLSGSITSKAGKKYGFASDQMDLSYRRQLQKLKKLDYIYEDPKTSLLSMTDKGIKAMSHFGYVDPETGKTEIYKETKVASNKGDSDDAKSQKEWGKFAKKWQSDWKKRVNGMKADLASGKITEVDVEKTFINNGYPKKDAKDLASRMAAEHGKDSKTKGHEAAMMAAAKEKRDKEGDDRIGKDKRLTKQEVQDLDALKEMIDNDNAYYDDMEPDEKKIVESLITAGKARWVGKGDEKKAALVGGSKSPAPKKGSKSKGKLDVGIDADRQLGEDDYGRMTEDEYADFVYDHAVKLAEIRGLNKNDEDVINDLFSELFKLKPTAMQALISKEKKESEMKKSVVLSASEIYEELHKGRALPDGTERNWKGRVYVKTGGKWVEKRKTDRKSTGSKSAEKEGKAASIAPKVGNRQFRVVKTYSGTTVRDQSDKHNAKDVTIPSTAKVYVSIFLPSRVDAASDTLKKQGFETAIISGNYHPGHGSDYKLLAWKATEKEKK